jgi:hypothetical protein
MLKVPSLPLPPGVPALLALFEGPLAEVQFPEVDRASLSSLAEDAVLAADTLARARAYLVDAQTALGEAEAATIASEAALVAKAQRALAYARVFAEGKVELTRELDAIDLCGSSKSAGSAVGQQRKSRGAAQTEARDSVASGSPDAPKRRGRPKQSDQRAASDLFVVPSVAGAAEETEPGVAAAS